MVGKADQYIGKFKFQNLFFWQGEEGAIAYKKALIQQEWQERQINKQENFGFTREHNRRVGDPMRKLQNKISRQAVEEA